MNTKKLFLPILKKMRTISCMLKIIGIPIGLISAKMIANMVTNSLNGEVKNVVQSGILLLSVLGGYYYCRAKIEVWFEKKCAVAVHQCKMLLYKYFLECPLYKHKEMNHGEIIETLNDDFNTVKDKYLVMLPALWSNMITAVVYFFYIMWKNQFIGLILLVISIIQIFPPLLIKKYLQVNYENNRAVEAEMTDYVVASYKGFALIKMYHLKDWYLKRLNELQKRYWKIGNKGEISGSTEESLTKLMDHILTYGLYAIIAFFILYKQITIEWGVQIIALGGALFSSIALLFSAISSFGVAIIAEQRIEKWFEVRSVKKPVMSQPDIEFEHVSFHYGEKLLFSDLSFHFCCEKKIMIKGKNGIGKSTLFRLITGECISTHGKVKIGGVEASFVSDSDFERNLLVLLQEDPEFSFSVNELFDIITKDKKEVCVRLADAFGLSNEIRKEKLSDLSGGQKKQVYLCIAFALNPPLILLDEPTNYMDQQGMQQFIKLLELRQEGVVIISHDSMLEPYMDEVYVMDGTEVIRQYA